jgi:tripartite-type tricarboxylate transporter receptor subunit TctC
MQMRRLQLALLLVLATIGPATSGHAQEWPQRPVRIISPYAAGGNSDTIARVLAHELEKAFGQPFVVENRPGASGAIAAETVMRSPADGYTLFLASLPQIAILPAVTRTSFDPVRDFVPISAIATNALALVVHPSLPVRSVADLVAYARAKKGQLTYAAGGIAGTTHLAMVFFLSRARVEMTAIPYKGGAPAIVDLIAGRVDAHFAIASSVIPYAKGDALRFLAVSSAQRLAQLPTVPTMIESGYPGFNLATWTGLMAPAGTPRQIVDRIARQASLSVKDAKTAALLAESGTEPLGNGPDEFAAMIAADVLVWRGAVKDAGLEPK